MRGTAYTNLNNQTSDLAVVRIFDCGQQETETARMTRGAHYVPGCYMDHLQLLGPPSSILHPPTRRSELTAATSKQWNSDRLTGVSFLVPTTNFQAEGPHVQVRTSQPSVLFVVDHLISHPLKHSFFLHL